MKRTPLAAALLLSFILSTQAYAQSSFATISGTVSDSTGALIPGVTVKATNTATNVASTVLSNEAGAYNLPGLLPGTYKVSAELSGFQVQTLTDVQLGNAQQVRLNFTLKVAGVAQSLEVSIPVDTLLATSSPTIGQVLGEKKVSDLPLVGNNVLNLIGVLSGVENVTSATFGRESTTFAGVSTTNITTVRDGVMVQDTRWPTGINSATVINPDLVGEIRLILAPVDAEVGRGNGTVQIQTRSGTNQFRGSAVWSFQNTALDPNSWANNHNQPRTLPDWQNRQQGTVSFGGPIVKNKTFFFALYDHNDQRQRTTANPMVLTPCARNGIFRYYDGWNNGNAQTATISTGGTPTIAVVDSVGNLKPPSTNPDGSAHNGVLRYFSLFGPVTNVPTKPDCSDAQIGAAPTTTGTWDPYRTRLDPSGFITRTLAFMPQANNYDTGDGLNTAGFRWLRRTGGLDNLWSVGEGTGIRNQYNVKIDQNFSAKHRGNVNVSYERVHSDDVVQGWPNTFSNLNYHRPMVVTGAFTSTLSPSLVNEARFGYRVTGTNVVAPWDRPDYQADLTKYLPAEVNGFRVLPVIPQSANLAFCYPYSGSRPPGSCGANAALTSTSLDDTPVWTYADTVSWTKGKHAFKFGAELRYLSTTSQLSQPGFFGNFKAVPQAFGGATALAGLATTGANAIANTNPFLLGLASTNASRARDLLNFFAGSLSQVSQLYFLTDPRNLDTWSDYRTEHLIKTTTKTREFDLFFKDDYKIHKNLTLNLGVRYEYYGVPFVASGLTVSPVGGGAAAFGISGRGFSGWMKPGPVAYDPTLLTQLQFVGPGSPNPGKSAYPDDWNNIGPAVGFAWQVPWFGENKTSVRGGYQITFQTPAKLGTLESPLAFPPGFTYQSSYTGDTSNPYLDLTMLSRAVPAPTQSLPMQPIKLTDRNQATSFFDPNLVSPYVQNLTLSVTRSLRRNMTLDVRYVGTLAVKQFRSFNLNSPNFLYNGLIDEFNSIRTGGESAMLNQMFQGINLCTGVLCGTAANYGPIGTAVNGVLQTAALQMRSSSQFNSNLANGDYQTIASTINTLNASVPAAAGVLGAALRNSGKFPENLIATNPQFTNVTYYSNLDHNNYHSLQTEVTLRPTHGFAGQATYTWSKNLGLGGGVNNALTNPVDRASEYTVVGGNRKHAVRTNGVVELPIGPNKLLLGNSTGILARALERWQLGLIYNLSSGQYTSIVANNMLYANGVPDIVHPFSLDDRGVRWGVPSGSFLEGRYFDPNKFVKVTDPQCNLVTGLQNLNGLNQAVPQARCTLTALAMIVPAGTPDSFPLGDGQTGQIVLQNPLPGKRGTLGQNVITGIPLWRFDANLSKAFRIGESKNIQLRLDALNVLNHPFPGAPNGTVAQGFNNPSLTIANTAASTPWGQIPSKTGARQFQGSLRLSF